MIRFRDSWPLAGLLSLLLDAVHLNTVRFPLAFAAGVVLSSLVGGLTAAVLASGSRAHPPAQRSLAVRSGYAALSALFVGFLAWLPFLLFWNSALGVVGITVGVIVATILVAAPAFAGMDGELPHVAVVRSIRSPGYGLIITVLLSAVLVATHENVFLGPLFSSPWLAKLVYAGAAGAIWSGAILVRSRSLRPGRNTDMQQGPPRVLIQAAQSIWLGYLISLTTVPIWLALPSRFRSWDPIFANWSFPDRFAFAGTTASLVLAVCAVAVIAFAWRAPLWVHVLTVLSFRMSNLLTPPWWKLTVGHLPMVAAGLAFFAAVAAALHWLSRPPAWRVARRATGGTPAP